LFGTLKVQSFEKDIPCVYYYAQVWGLLHMQYMRSAQSQWHSIWRQSKAWNKTRGHPTQHTLAKPWQTLDPATHLLLQVRAYEEYGLAVSLGVCTLVPWVNPPIRRAQSLSSCSFVESPSDSQTCQTKHRISRTLTQSIGVVTWSGAMQPRPAWNEPLCSSRWVQFRHWRHKPSFVELSIFEMMACMHLMACWQSSNMYVIRAVVQYMDSPSNNARKKAVSLEFDLQSSIYSTRVLCIS